MQNTAMDALGSTAAQRTDANLLPPPDSIGAQEARIRRAILPLIKNGLVNEAATTDIALAWRAEDGAQYGAFITDTGRQLIGAEPATPPAENPDSVQAGTAPEPHRPPTKAASVLDMLRRQQGATLDELASATGWLPHTTRAALTGIRKKGHALAKGKRAETTCYSLFQAA